jgi:hypothetical protein
VCFTNARVLAYNKAIHEELYGLHIGACFAEGERVIVHEPGVHETRIEPAASTMGHLRRVSRRSSHHVA